MDLTALRVSATFSAGLTMAEPWEGKRVQPSQIRCKLEPAAHAYCFPWLGNSPGLMGWYMQVDLMIDQEQILERVRSELSDALDVDKKDIRPESFLVDDLGAESIDFLDITFRLEKSFRISIDEKEIVGDPYFLRTSGFVQQGRLSPEGVTKLQKECPTFNPQKFPRGIREGDLARLVTVQFLVNLVSKKVKTSK